MINDKIKYLVEVEALADVGKERMGVADKMEIFTNVAVGFSAPKTMMPKGNWTVRESMVDCGDTY